LTLNLRGRQKRESGPGKGTLKGRPGTRGRTPETLKRDNLGRNQRAKDGNREKYRKVEKTGARSGKEGTDRNRKVPKRDRI
jgi:hypothetical protein